MVGDDRCDLLCLDLPVAERLRQRRLADAVATTAASRAAALGDPTRLRLAATLLDVEELCVCDLAWILERSQTLVSHHARLLRKRGVVESRRDGKMVLYALTADGRDLITSVLATASEWFTHV
jgi:DNA-binding transcriptional ArsR family regulator